MTITKITNRNTDTVFEIDESKTLSDMEKACPRFFKNRHGKRETFSEHRGCLIARHTVQYTRCKPKRETVVYIFCELEGSMDLFCVSIGSPDLNSVRQAKRFIDRLLDGGVYYYGVNP